MRTTHSNYSNGYQPNQMHPPQQGYPLDPYDENTAKSGHIMK
jgi:hypothetical protein